MAPLLECRELTKKYGSMVALNNLSLTLNRGRIIGLLGPNASGKTTFIKLITGLLTPTHGEILINGASPGPESKLSVAYLPDVSFLNDWMTVEQTFNYYKDFYSNFIIDKAYDMLARLGIDPKMKLKSMSKGTKEKVQLILTMSRNADLYCLDEPIGGVDPASRDYILDTIINNYNPEGSILISTHLISDIEKVLDEVVIIKQGCLYMYNSVDNIREQRGMSVDALFREVFRC